MNTKKRIESLTEKQKNILGIIVFVLFLIFCGLVGLVIGKPMLEFVSEPEEFRKWGDSHGIWGKIAFIGMTVFQVVIATVPGEPLEIGAGYAFGALEGTLLCVIGITLGSLVVFYLVKTFGIRFVEIFFSVEKIKNLKILKKSHKRDLLIFLIFFLPGTPKDLITYFAPLTDIKMKNFLILVSVARLPSIITSTLGGSALGVEKYKTAIIVFAATLMVSGVGWIIYNFLIKGKRKKEKRLK